RVQHYGWKYDYKAKKVASDMRLGALPVPLMELANNLYTDGYVKDIPDQVIINEYEPGQGIASHTDCKPCFGDTIITISLGSGCVMEFTKEVGESSGNRKKPSMSKNKTPVWLLPRSLVAMTGDARWDWCHGIPQRKSDQWGGKRYKRSRRVSLTFRKVRLESEG
ncbi:MAG: alpha-ketoglutarate-dependent dioxygenase AlkB, partial [Pseudomonadales bacterium]